MPEDSPEIGEIWALPNLPSLTTSGEGGRAIIETIEADRVQLISELQGRRLIFPLRSFLLTWTFVRKVVQINGRCSSIRCQNQAWFNQLGESGGDPYCFEHFIPNRRIYFWADDSQPSLSRGVRQLGRLGGVSRPDVVLPDTAGKTFTNDAPVIPQADAPRNLSAGAKWWHKTRHELIYVVDVLNTPDGMGVRYSSGEVFERLPLSQFVETFQVERPTPHCQVEEEWVDSRDHVIRVVALEERGALVQGASGAKYLLPYHQFARWKKIERRTVYDRLVEDD